MNTFSQFLVEQQKHDAIVFLETNYQYAIDEHALFDSLIFVYGNDPIILEAWGDWWNTAKDYAKKAWNWANTKQLSLKDLASGTGNFAKGVVAGAKKGFVDTNTDEAIKKIEAVGDQISKFSKDFSEKFKVDPVTAAIVISAGFTGGIGAIPMIAIPIALRRTGSWLSNKAFDAAWQGVTGMTPDQTDQMYQQYFGLDQKNQAAPQAAPQAGKPMPVPAAGKPMPVPATGKPMPVPTAGKPMPVVPNDFVNVGYNAAESVAGELTFERFLMDKDLELYMEIKWLQNLWNKGVDAVKGYAKDVGERGFGTATGERVGKALGTGAGYFMNIGTVIAKSIANIGRFMKNNPIKTSKLIMGLAVGSMIGHYGTKAINDFINKPSQAQLKELADASKKAGVPDNELPMASKEDMRSYLPKDKGDYPELWDKDSTGRISWTDKDGGSYLQPKLDTSYSGGGGDIGNAVSAKASAADAMSAKSDTVASAVQKKMSVDSAVRNAKMEIIDKIKSGQINDYESLQQATLDAQRKYHGLLKPTFGSTGHSITRFDDDLDMNLKILGGNQLGNAAEMAKKIIKGAGGTPNLDSINKMSDAMKDAKKALSSNNVLADYGMD